MAKLYVLNSYFPLFFFRPPPVAPKRAKADHQSLLRSENVSLITSPLTKPAKAQRPRRLRRRYNPKNRHERKESERFKSFTYEELIKRDKLNLDIFWLKDESLEDSANLPDPDIIAAEIVEDLQAALAQFAEIAADLKNSRRR